VWVLWCVFTIGSQFSCGDTRLYGARRSLCIQIHRGHRVVDVSCSRIRRRCSVRILYTYPTPGALQVSHTSPVSPGSLERANRKSPSPPPHLVGKVKRAKTFTSSHFGPTKRHGLKPGRSASRASKHGVTESERPLLKAARSHDAPGLAREARDRRPLRATGMVRGYAHFSHTFRTRFTHVSHTFHTRFTL
jgi:hypothetical protein